MTPNLSIETIIYGLVIAGLSLVTFRLAPELGALALLKGIVGGGLSIFFGVLGLCGSRGRKGATLTTTAILLILIVQAAAAWIKLGICQQDARLVMSLIILMLGFSSCLLRLLTHSDEE